MNFETNYLKIRTAIAYKLIKRLFWKSYQQPPVNPIKSLGKSIFI